MMRVTSGSYADRLISNLGSITSRQARYQAQISTGQRVALPEDDPAASWLKARAVWFKKNPPPPGWAGEIQSLTK